MKHNLRKFCIICITVLFIAVFSAGCISPSEPVVDPISPSEPVVDPIAPSEPVFDYTTSVVEEGDGFVSYIYLNEETLEVSLELYFENDSIPVYLWESSSKMFFDAFIPVLAEEGVTLIEGQAYTHIDGVGYTTSYDKTKGFTYKTGEAKVCPIEIPPSL